MIWPDNSNYKGYWKDGLMTGVGIIKFSNGE